MAKPLLPDGLWNRIAPLLPPPKPRRFRYPGRKPIDNRSKASPNPLRPWLARSGTQVAPIGAEIGQFLSRGINHRWPLG
jgi:hypothetical protein